MAQDSVAGRREFGAQMEAHRAGERDGEFKAVRPGWCLGGEEFRPELFAQVAEKRATGIAARNWRSRTKPGRNG